MLCSKKYLLSRNVSNHRCTLNKVDNRNDGVQYYVQYGTVSAERSCSGKLELNCHFYEVTYPPVKGLKLSIFLSHAGISTTTTPTTTSRPPRRQGQTVCSYTFHPDNNNRALRVNVQDKLMEFNSGSLSNCKRQCYYDNRCRSITFRRYTKL